MDSNFVNFYTEEQEIFSENNDVNILPESVITTSRDHRKVDKGI